MSWDESAAGLFGRTCHQWHRDRKSRLESLLLYLGRSNGRGYSGWHLDIAETSPVAAPVEGAVHTPMVVRLWTEIDWTGGVIAAAGLALLAYVLAILSADLSDIHKASTAVLLTLSIVLPCVPAMDETARPQR